MTTTAVAPPTYTFAPRNMKALRFHRRGEIYLEEVPTSPCGPDEVRVKIAYCGICGSDIHEFLGGPIFTPEPGKANPFTGVRLPVTMGHEMSGTITEVGSEVSNLRKGQRVTVNPALDERHHGLDACSMCQIGRYNICGKSATYGLSAEGGGFSDEIVVKSLNCIVLPEGVNLKVGALIEPLAVAWHCIDISGFKKGQIALISGAGPIGLAILLLLRVAGASKVIITEVTASRIAQAKKFGADVVVNPLEKSESQGQDQVDPVLAAVHDHTSDGVDVAFDATGLQSTLDTAIASVKPGGTIFNVAIHEKPLLLNLNDLARKEKKLMGGICYTNKDFEAVLEILASGNVDAEQMITSIVPLADVVDGGFKELINNKAAHVKILIQPSGGIAV